MSQFDKFLNRIRTIDKDLRFDELRKVLEYYGYIMDESSGGSHKVFRKPGFPTITIPRHTPIKRIYIILVKELIEREESDDEKS